MRLHKHQSDRIIVNLSGIQDKAYLLKLAHLFSLDLGKKPEHILDNMVDQNWNQMIITFNLAFSDWVDLIE
jgi:hypothetical protein